MKIINSIIGILTIIYGCILFYIITYVEEVELIYKVIGFLILIVGVLYLKKAKFEKQ